MKYTETAKTSEKDTAKMETTISELNEKLSQEEEKCKRLQDDLSSYTERESKLSQSMTSVSITRILSLVPDLFCFSIVLLFSIETGRTN